LPASPCEQGKIQGKPKKSAAPALFGAQNRPKIQLFPAKTSLPARTGNFLAKTGKGTGKRIGGEQGMG
jgi:hypothetical protein